MPYKVSISESGRYVLTVIKGAVDTVIANKFSAEARDVAKRHGLDAFLFDARDASNVESAFQNYLYAVSDMDRLNLSKTARSAIITSPGDTSHDMFEVFSQKAGYNVRIFTDFTAGERWLETGEEEPEPDDE